MKEYKFFVAGEWRSSPERATVCFPYDGTPVAEVYQATEGDLEDAVSAAVAAFEVTRRLPAYKRAEVLANTARAIAARREEIARTITEEAGKPINDSRFEVSRAVVTFTVASEEAKRIDGEMVPMDIVPGAESKIAVVRRFPIGPVLAISAFNFPLNLVAHKVAPAIAAGNPVIVKPAPQTPITSLLLAEIIAGAGWPAGALSVLPCSNPLAERLVADDRIKLLNFTGSDKVGWYLKQRAGQKRVLLEMGGNGTVVIDRDADLDAAAQRATFGAFFYAGQVCVSVQRVLVHGEIYQPFLDKFLPRVRALKLGDPREESTNVGPMISEEAARRAEAEINEALSGGARALVGGGRRGTLVEPTVLVDTTPEMRVNCQEVFAPLVTVVPFSTFDEAIAVLNSSEYGLQAGIFTRDLGRAFRAFNELAVGGLVINDIPTYRADHLPWGGVKKSGLGREGIRYAIEEMTEPKALIINP